MNWKIARKNYLKKLDKETKQRIKSSWKRAFKDLKKRYIKGNGVFIYSETEYYLPDLLAEKIKKFLKRKRINFTFEKVRFSALGKLHYDFHMENK